MSYAFYPGCSLGATALPYGVSFQEVARVLELDMPELEDWNCCGATSYQALDEVSSLSLSGRNLVLAEKAGKQDLVTPCAGCFAALRKASVHLAHPSETQRKAEAALAAASLAYQGSVRVRHILDVLVHDVGLDAVRAKVVQPLAGLKVACYYGCLLTRPPAIAAEAHPEYPVTMDRLMAALGAEPVDWSFKTECCGAGFAVSRPDLAARLTGRILSNAAAVGADLVVTVCPLCHANLDAYHGQEAALPAVYFTQLMGVAFGLRPSALGLNKHLRSPAPALECRGLLARDARLVKT